MTEIGSLHDTVTWPCQSQKSVVTQNEWQKWKELVEKKICWNLRPSWKRFEERFQRFQVSSHWSQSANSKSPVTISMRNLYHLSYLSKLFVCKPIEVTKKSGFTPTILCREIQRKRVPEKSMSSPTLFRTGTFSANPSYSSRWWCASSFLPCWVFHSSSGVNRNTRRNTCQVYSSSCNLICWNPSSCQTPLVPPREGYVTRSELKNIQTKSQVSGFCNLTIDTDSRWTW